MFMNISVYRVSKGFGVSNYLGSLHEHMVYLPISFDWTTPRCGLRPI